MVDVGVMPGNDRDAFQEAGLCSCAFSIRALNTEAHHLAAFWKAFFMANIKPIETLYGGHRFRSRLEARWAVFFDAINLRFEYELEGFQGDGWSYLPDFYFPDHDVYAEVKPMATMTKQDIHVGLQFALAGKRLLWCLDAPEEAPFMPMFAYGVSKPADEFFAEDDERGDGLLPEVHLLVNNGVRVQFAIDVMSAKPVLAYHNCDAIQDAADFAKQARFEFGETPKSPRDRQ